MRRVLILGGTKEAAALASAIAGRRDIEATLSLAGRTEAPMRQTLPTRIGGFGGVAGLRRWLREHRIDCVIDATHPFATQMSAHAVAACAAEGVDRVRLTRAPWVQTEGDRWTIVPDLPAAAYALGKTPRRVFLPIGRNSLAPFAEAPQHFYLVRSIDAPEDLSALPQHAVLLARPPFTLAQEIGTLRENRIDVIVTKNSGGDTTSAKLIAARELGVPVVIVARPTALEGRVCYDIATALTLVGLRD